jgi:hypothetical protein
MEFAVELMHTSKAFHSMVCKRLEIISHEDIDTASQPHIVPFVATAVAQAMRWYDAEKPGASRLAIGNAIRLMCREEKPRGRSLRCGQSDCGHCLRALRRRSPTGPTIGTHSPGASWGAVSIISARKARSWYRSQPNPTCLSRKPTGSGRSSSRARDGAGRSRHERTHALWVSSCGATICPVLDGNRKYSTQGQNDANNPLRSFWRLRQSTAGSAQPSAGIGLHQARVRSRYL